jgi:hypothetical protein
LDAQYYDQMVPNRSCDRRSSGASPYVDDPERGADVDDDGKLDLGSETDNWLRAIPQTAGQLDLGFCGPLRSSVDCARR